MIYVNWFEAAKSLLNIDDERIDENDRRALSWAANMWLPQDTQIILLREGHPKTFPLDTPHLKDRPELYGEGFYLPRQGVMVEDEVSAVGLVDLKKDSLGLNAMRTYCLIEGKQSASSGRIESLEDVFAKRLFDAEFPDDGFLMTFGILQNVGNLNLGLDNIASVKAIPLYFGTITPREVLGSATSSRLCALLNREPEPLNREEENEQFSKLVEEFGSYLASTLAVGHFQIAYHNALVERK